MSSSAAIYGTSPDPRRGPEAAPFARRPLAAWLAAALAAAVAGAAVVVATPIAVAGACALVLATMLLTSRTRTIRTFHVALAALLVGYAFFGRGLAHVGVGQLYVGELVLSLAVLALVVTLPRVRVGFLPAFLIVFMGWGLLCTVPYLSVYGINSLRDAVSWGYGLFALAVVWTVREDHFEGIVRAYRRLVPIFLLWVPVTGVLNRVFGSYVPTLPTSDVPLLAFKGGDMGVQLAGVGAFILLGLYGSSGRLSVVRELALWILWLAGVFIAGTVNRGGLLASAMVASSALFVRQSARWLSVGFATVLVFAGLLLANPNVPTDYRTLSLSQLADNVASIATSTGDQASQATKDFRLAWWGKIVQYTFEGPYFWTGKGYGINLADADGFQVTSDDSLRAPHSAQFDFLARMGVPGFAMWVLLQSAFAAALIWAAFRARRERLGWWVRILGWIFVYWLAAIVNMSFDPYLQGPQGGIPFWAMFGLGIVAIRATDAAIVGERTARKAPLAAALAASAHA